MVCGKPFPKPGHQPCVDLSTPPSRSGTEVPQPQATKPETRHDEGSAPMPPPFFRATIDSDEYARRFPPQDRSPVRRVVRFAAFTLAWSAAIGVGAFGAHWVDDNGGTEAVLRKLLPKLSHTENGQVETSSTSGTAELPNDGVNQPQLRAAQTIETPVVRQVPTTPLAPAPREAMQNSAGTRTNVRNQDQQEFAAKVQSPETSSGSTGAQVESSSNTVDTTDAAVSKPAAAKATKQIAKLATGKSSASQSAKTTKSNKKPSSTAQKIARGREINRIQQQAADELKKKTRKRRNTVEHAKTRTKLSFYASPKALRMRQSLARCEKLDSLFSREQCKWRLCGGQWGKNGCPSYARDKVASD